MEGFFQLIEQFNTQDEPAYCGLASIAMTLNTLRIDPVASHTWPTLGNSASQSKYL